MWLLDRILQSIGVRPFTADAVINAEQDEALEKHTKALRSLEKATERRREGNAVLRESLQTARARTAGVFADFEHLLEADQRRNRRKGKPNGNGG